MLHKFRCAVTAAFATMAIALSAADNPDWGNLGCYHESNKQIAAEENPGNRVVFLGNSITFNWAWTRPDFFTSNGFIGRGISGQTSYQFLVRFREDVVNLHPALVVINAATNDVAENTGPYNEDYTFGNIASMVEIARANGIKVILTTTLPAAAFGWNPNITDAPQKIASLNKRIRKYAEANGIPFVDYYSSMLSKGDPNLALDPRYSTDGVHPTDAGYEVMEAIILPAIRKIVPAPTSDK